MIGVRKGQVVVHDGGEPVLEEPGDLQPPLTLALKDLQDNGSVATMVFADAKDQKLTVELDRPDRAVIRRKIPGEWKFCCDGTPLRDGNRITFNTGVTMEVKSGSISQWEPGGYHPKLAVGFDKLVLKDPAPKGLTLCNITPPASGEIVIEFLRGAAEGRK